MTKDKNRLRRWYEKGFPWVYKTNCSLCGNEFFTLDRSQLVCDQETCRAKWQTMQRKGNETNYDISRKNHINESGEGT